MLKQWLVLYFFLMFGIGIFSLGFVCVAYARVRNSVLKSYLYYDVSFTLFIVVWMLVYYFCANFPLIEPEHPLLVWLNYAQGILTLLLMLTLPLFLHELFACTHRRRRNFAIMLVVVGNYLTIHLDIAVFIWRGEGSLMLAILGHIFLIGILIYSLLLSLLHYKRNSQSRSARLMALFLGGTVAMQIESSFFILLSLHLASRLPIFDMPLFPLMYGGSSLIFGIYFFSKYWVSHPSSTVAPLASGDVSAACAPQSNTADDTQAFEALCAQHQLSARECEVLVLLLHGQTNTQIGEQLFISLNTAKTHISNIYQKMGVKRRYELLARCKELVLPALNAENQ